LKGAVEGSYACRAGPSGERQAAGALRKQPPARPVPTKEEPT
jgi:hypothetical protein